MSLARHERRTLRRIDRALSRSAPRVHAKFWAFEQVCSEQAMPGWEQILPARGGLGRSTLRRRLSQGILLALMYAGGITWPPDTADDHVGQQARKW
jgi:hypothetical protein